MTEDLSSLREQLRQLAADKAKGALDDAQFGARKTALERRILEAVMAGGGASSAAPGGPGPSRRMLGLAVAAVVAVAALGYWWTGKPSAIGVAGGPPQGMRGGPAGGTEGGGTAPGGAAHEVTAEQIQAMIDQLAARLQDKPDDPDGWAMLARSYAVTGRHKDAVGAFERAHALRRDDAVLLADYADTLAMSLGRSLEGKPLDLVQQALKIDPANLKALSLAGTAAFNRKDYAGAIAYWERLQKAAPSDNVFVRQIASGIEEARALAAGQGLAPAPQAQAADPARAGAAAGPARVTGTVTLAPALAKEASPDDTVFIFARAAGGAGGMPLAILRKQVKDLPFDFTLDDSLAMSPAAKLSGAPQVMVSARVSRSGNATPQSGDLQGAVGPVPLGAAGVAVQITERRP